MEEERNITKKLVEDEELEMEGDNSRLEPVNINKESRDKESGNGSDTEIANIHVDMTSKKVVQEYARGDTEK